VSEPAPASGTPPEDLAPDRLGERIRTRWLGRSLTVRGETGSTMDDARRAAEGGAPEGHLVVADAQRDGRGAHGRRWSSPGGTDLYLSFVLRPAPRDAPRLPLVTLATGLGVADAADAVLGARAARIRWPNDVLVPTRSPGADPDGTKTAGVLVEASALGDRVDAVIVGVGLDVNRVRFPSDLAEVATSLRASRAALTDGAEAEALDRGAVLERLLGDIEGRLDALREAGAAAVVPALEARLAYRGRAVHVEGEGDGPGRIVGLDPDGALRLESPGGTIRRLTAGRVRPAPNAPGLAPDGGGEPGDRR